MLRCGASAWRRLPTAISSASDSYGYGISWIVVPACLPFCLLLCVLWCVSVCSVSVFSVLCVFLFLVVVWLSYCATLCASARPPRHSRKTHVEQAQRHALCCAVGLFVVCGAACVCFLYMLCAFLQCFPFKIKTPQNANGKRNLSRA
jgi:hypothetical protein